MKVHVYPADQGGCGHYRMIWPAHAVRDTFGDDLTVLIAGEDDEQMAPITVIWSQEWDRGLHALPPAWVHVRGIKERPDFDVMVIQRPLHRQYAELIPHLQEMGITVVIDIDDNFDRIDRANAAWFPCEPHWQHKDQLKGDPREVVIDKMSADRQWLHTPQDSGVSHRQWLSAAVGLADLTTVSTPALAVHYGRLGRTQVIRNRVPARYIGLRDQRARRVNQWVGWTGSVATHPEDLAELGSAVRDARAVGGWEFHVVGTGAGVGHVLQTPVDHATQWVPIDQYANEYAELDIALCPLADNAFNESKSALKMLEAMAVGAVPLVSPSAEYMRLAQEVGEFPICTRPRQWTGKIKKLLTDTTFQEEMRQLGYIIAGQYTYETAAHEWVGAWMKARANT